VNAEEERVSTPAGGGNSDGARICAAGGRRRGGTRWIPEKTRIFTIARVNWLDGLEAHCASAAEPSANGFGFADLAGGGGRTGAAHAALNETDQYWINVSNGFAFSEGMESDFLWSSERSGYRQSLSLRFGRQAACGRSPRVTGKFTAVDAVDEGKGLVYFTRARRNLRWRGICIACRSMARRLAASPFTTGRMG